MVGKLQILGQQVLTQSTLIIKDNDIPSGTLDGNLSRFPLFVGGGGRSSLVSEGDMVEKLQIGHVFHIYGVVLCHV